MLLHTQPSSGSCNRRKQRLLWIVNHKTLLPAEVPILRSLGWEVFVPKTIPSHDPGYRSAVVTFEYDSSLNLPPAALAVLNAHRWYEQPWPPTVVCIVNDYFQAVVSHFSYYTMPLSEAARKFHGIVIARAFGREHPRTYSEFVNVGPRKHLLREIDALHERFIFAQGYDNLAEIEDTVLQRTAYTITVPLPRDIYRHQGQWIGGGQAAVFLCPAISDVGFYRSVYEGIKRDFGSLPHVIFGRQVNPPNDPAILPYLTEEELIELYARAPVFVYPHTEPRHIHYSPLEAIVVGTPVLYLRNSLIGELAGHADLPGACSNVVEMRVKAQSLISGDASLAELVRSGQGCIMRHFSTGLARQQWRKALARAPLSSSPTAVAGNGAASFVIATAV